MRPGRARLGHRCLTQCSQEATGFGEPGPHRLSHPVGQGRSPGGPDRVISRASWGSRRTQPPAYCRALLLVPPSRPASRLFRLRPVPGEVGGPVTCSRRTLARELTPFPACLRPGARAGQRMLPASAESQAPTKGLGSWPPRVCRPLGLGTLSTCCVLFWAPVAGAPWGTLS